MIRNIKETWIFSKGGQTTNNDVYSVSVFLHPSHPSKLHVTYECDEMPSTCSLRSLGTELNRIGLRTENIPVKKSLCKRT